MYSSVNAQQDSSARLVLGAGPDIPLLHNTSQTINVRSIT